MLGDSWVGRRASPFALGGPTRLTLGWSLYADHLGFVLTAGRADVLALHSWRGPTCCALGWSLFPNSWKRRGDNWVGRRALPFALGGPTRLALGGSLYAVRLRIEPTAGRADALPLQTSEKSNLTFSFSRPIQTSEKSNLTFSFSRQRLAANRAQDR